MSKGFYLATACALAGCESISPTSPPQVRPPLVFLLAGQSNMSGRGVLAEAQGDALKADERIRMYGNDGTLVVAREPVDSAVGQQDVVSADLAAGVGPGLSFAKQVVAHQANRRIILVPCAKGGSAISAWEPSLATSSLYGSCLKRAQAAAIHGKVAGILWYQGESDADTSELVRDWSGSFARLADTFRRDLNLPGLPVVMVAIGDRPTDGAYGKRFPEWREMQRVQLSVKGRCIAVVPAAGLPRNVDGLHLSTAAQIKLGFMLAKKWESLAQRCK